MADYKKIHGERATISYVGVQDSGEHIETGLLPGTKYWALQNGSTPEMYRHNLEDVFESHPDFIVVRRLLPDYDKYVERLVKEGYEYVMEFSYSGESTRRELMNAVYVKNRSEPPS